jgi:hypothetical protein
MEFVKQIVKQIVDKLFCCHDFKLFREILVDKDSSRYKIHIFKCIKCGKFKKLKVKYNGNE